MLLWGSLPWGVWGAIAPDLAGPQNHVGVSLMMPGPQPRPVGSENAAPGPGECGLWQASLGRCWVLGGAETEKGDPEGPTTEHVLAAPPPPLPGDLLNEGSRESPPPALLCLSTALFSGMRKLDARLLVLCLSFHMHGPSSPPREFSVSLVASGCVWCLHKASEDLGGLDLGATGGLVRRHSPPTEILPRLNLEAGLYQTFPEAPRSQGSALAALLSVAGCVCVYV